MAAEQYSQQDYDIARAFMVRLASTQIEQIAIRKIQETMKDASAYEISDALLRVARKARTDDNTLSVDTAEKLAVIEDGAIYKAMEDTIHYFRAIGRYEGQER